MIRLVVASATRTVVEAEGAGCAVVAAVDGELELTDVDGESWNVEVVSVPADEDVPEGSLEEYTSSLFVEESLAVFGEGRLAAIAVRGVGGFGFGVVCDADPERGLSVGGVLSVLVDDVAPVGVLAVDPSLPFVEEPVASSVAVSVSGVEGFGFGVVCDADPERVSSVDEVWSVLVDDDVPVGLLDVGRLLLSAEESFAAFGEGWLGVVSARAVPAPVKTATPTPKATASPPTRPMYREAPMLPPAVDNC